MGINDGMPIYHYLAEVQVRGADCLHLSDEHENASTDGKEAQRKGHQTEKYSEKSGESQCWANDPDGLRTSGESHGSNQIHYRWSPFCQCGGTSLDELRLPGATGQTGGQNL